MGIPTNRLYETDLLLTDGQQGALEARIRDKPVPQDTESFQGGYSLSTVCAPLALQMRDLGNQPILGFISQGMRLIGLRYSRTF